MLDMRVIFTIAAFIVLVLAVTAALDASAVVTVEAQSQYPVWVYVNLVSEDGWTWRGVTVNGCTVYAAEARGQVLLPPGTYRVVGVGAEWASHDGGPVWASWRGEAMDCNGDGSIDEGYIVMRITTSGGASQTSTGVPTGGLGLPRAWTVTVEGFALLEPGGFSDTIVVREGEPIIVWLPEPMPARGTMIEAWRLVDGRWVPFNAKGIVYGDDRRSSIVAVVIADPLPVGEHTIRVRVDATASLILEAELTVSEGQSGSGSGGAIHLETALALGIPFLLFTLAVSVMIYMHGRR